METAQPIIAASTIEGVGFVGNTCSSRRVIPPSRTRKLLLHPMNKTLASANALVGEYLLQSNEYLKALGHLHRALLSMEAVLPEGLANKSTHML